MKYPKTFLGLAVASIIAAALFLATSGGLAVAQGPFEDVLAFITNDEANPVPVVPAGRQRYQTTFGVYTESGEDCDPVEIPEGMVLTIESVGVRFETDGAGPPFVYVRVVRDTLSGFSIYRYAGTVSPSGPFYDGIFNLTAFAGPVDEDLTYVAGICVGNPSGGATYNSARGIVSGYLEPGSIFDASLIP